MVIDYEPATEPGVNLKPGTPPLEPGANALGRRYSGRFERPPLSLQKNPLLDHITQHMAERSRLLYERCDRGGPSGAAADAGKDKR
ncbi:MAG: hypothetical protein M3O41_08255 [Pseudomonadota bacterium]|nr:hypothetical protein [Pseudomonadota bacterium]